MTPYRRQEIEELIDSIVDPAMKEHWSKQLAMSVDMDLSGLSHIQKPFDDEQSGGKDESEPSRRTYVFQWFQQDDATEAYESLVVHTAGSGRALALFEQNAAAGTLAQVSPRCEVLALDADDCRTCFGAGKLSIRGKQRTPCEACNGSGKR